MSREEIPQFYIERYKDGNTKKRNHVIKKLTKKYKKVRIAEAFGVSRQRIDQILNKEKIDKIKKQKRLAYLKSLSKAKRRELTPPLSSVSRKGLEKLGGRDRTRELVRMRDNHTCQTCGKKWEEGQRRFDVHHLNGVCGKKSRKYDKVRDHVGLITLCHKCHFNHPSHTVQRRINKKLSTPPR